MTARIGVITFPGSLDAAATLSSTTPRIAY